MEWPFAMILTVEPVVEPVRCWSSDDEVEAGGGRRGSGDRVAERG